MLQESHSRPSSGSWWRFRRLLFTIVYHNSHNYQNINYYDYSNYLQLGWMVMDVFHIVDHICSRCGRWKIIYWTKLCFAR